MLLSKKNQTKKEKSAKQSSDKTNNNPNIDKQIQQKFNRKPITQINKESKLKKHSYYHKNMRSKSSLKGQKCFSEKESKNKLITNNNQDDSQTQIKAQVINHKNKLIQRELQKKQRIRQRIVQSTSNQGNALNQQQKKITIHSQIKKALPQTIPKENQASPVGNSQLKIHQQQILQYQNICNQIQLKNLQSKAIVPLNVNKSPQNQNFLNKIEQSQSGVTKQLSHQIKFSQSHFIPYIEQQQSHDFQHPGSQIISYQQQNVNKNSSRVAGKIQSNLGKKSIKKEINSSNYDNQNERQRSESISQKPSNRIIAIKLYQQPNNSGKIARTKNQNMTIVPEIVNFNLNYNHQQKKQYLKLDEQVLQLRKTVRQLRLEKIKAQAQLIDAEFISKTISFQLQSRNRYQNFDSLLTISNQQKKQKEYYKVDNQIPLFGRIRKNRSLSRKKASMIPQISQQTVFDKHRHCENQSKTVCLQKITEQHMQQSGFPQQAYKKTGPSGQTIYLKSNLRPQDIGEMIMDKFQRSQKKFKSFVKKQVAKSKINRSPAQFQQYISSTNNPEKSKRFTQQQNDQQILDNILQLNHRMSWFSKKQNNKLQIQKYISDKNMSLIIQGQKLNLQVKKANMIDVSIPNIPQAPNQQTKTEELMNLILQILPITGNQYKEQQLSKCTLKRYKNCISFQISSNLNFRIVWNFTNKLYMGEWDSVYNQKSGNGIQIVKDKSYYKGQFVDGKKNGHGLMVYSNGSMYEGEWHNGQRQGYGKYKDTNKSFYYEGHWKNDKKQGQAHQQHKQNIFQGQFYKNFKQGLGVQLFKNGDKYIGEYQNGKFHGQGKYNWKNGDVYIGHFSDGYKHGYGKWQSGQQKSEIYIGQFSKDKKQGKGKYLWSNRCIYEGCFRDDLKHGMGNIQYPDGRYMQGIWTLGILTEVISKITQAHREQPLEQPKSRSVQTKTLIKVFDRSVDQIQE